MTDDLVALSAHQHEQLAELERQALAFNEKLNLYSEASAAAFKQRHIAHSLTLATHSFPPGSVVADWGTGGGMPGLVLAIAFPNIPFHLIDSVGKKVRAVRSMARRLELRNVEAHHARAETWEGVITHSVSRATAPLETLWAWHTRVAARLESQRGSMTEDKVWPPGLLCLKGGDLQNEIEALTENDGTVIVKTTPVTRWLGAPYFADKVLLQVTLG